MEEFFGLLELILRAPISCESGTLSTFEEYILIDAYRFVKAGTFYPYAPPDETYLEYQFITKAYPIFYFDQRPDSPRVHQAVTEMEDMFK